MKYWLSLIIFFLFASPAFAQQGWFDVTQSQQRNINNTQLSQFQVQQRPGNLSYTPLEPFYAFQQADINSGNFGSLINNVFRVLIGLGALIAVVTLVIGGVMYMTTEVTGTKEEAKRRMLNSIYGLVLLGGSVLILNTINPQLTLIRFTPGDITGQAPPTAQVNVGSAYTNNHNQNKIICEQQRGGTYQIIGQNADRTDVGQCMVP